MNKILEVKNLKISFRTASGTVKAVRDISFDLARGETLAIVGESGSGKSVTSKAILGILAGNSIIESGEILYDGKDLLKVSEDDMHKIRGDKISMIFQDPLSSLDPIVKIGKQITEAMLLKNKANRRSGRIEFNEMLTVLKENMLAAAGSDNPQTVVRINELIQTFDKFNIEAITLESSYNNAHTQAIEIIADIEDVLFRIEKKQRIDIKLTISDIVKKLRFVKDDFLTSAYDVKITECSEKLSAEKKTAGIIKTKKGSDEKEINVTQSTIDALKETREVLADVTTQKRPNFFRVGYYKYKNPEAELKGMDIDEMNEMALRYINENFMDEFIDLELQGVKHSYDRSIENKRNTVELIGRVRGYFENKDIEKTEIKKIFKEICIAVESSIDRLATVKDSTAYTFPSSLQNAIYKYFYYKVNNPKEEARFDRQTKKRNQLIAKGKTVDWKVVPKVVYDLDELKDNIIKVLNNITEKYKEDIAVSADVDYMAKSVALIDFLKEKASQVVYRVTPRIAKEQAIKLMEEVGIPEPRIRYYQYPFQFSGGMRQRIVIAIALAANPDILICDEPTTALDVTIQAQILELINNLKNERNLTVIFITHDLGVVANIADKIAVMYAGKIVEYGTADDIFYDPRHPYTWALLSSMPDLDTNDKLDAIPGTPPNMIYVPEGDAFAARNKYALKIDFEKQPPMFEISSTHCAATWLLHPDAPKVEVPKIITDRIIRMKKLGGGTDDGQ